MDYSGGPCCFLKLFKCSVALLIHPWCRFPPVPFLPLRTCELRESVVIPVFTSVVRSYARYTSSQESIYFEPNVNTGLRGSGGQRRQKHRRSIDSLYNACCDIIASVSGQSVTLQKAILIPAAQPQQTFWHFVFLSCFPQHHNQPSNVSKLRRLHGTEASASDGLWTLAVWGLQVTWRRVGPLRLNLVLREEERRW